MTGDRELWERIRGGDARAFDDFYRENAPRLRGFLRQILGDAQAAEDVAQETFLELWRRGEGFCADRGSLRAYLFGIGRKRAMDWWRRRKPQAREIVLELRAFTPETISLVDDAFSRLGANERALLWLREVEGQSYIELAEILEIPIGTVRSRLFAAREELRRVWHSSRTEGEPRHEVRRGR